MLGSWFVRCLLCSESEKISNFSTHETADHVLSSPLLQQFNHFFLIQPPRGI